MFKRLDALFLGIWTTGLFAKMALFLYLVSLCIHRIWGAVAARWSILISGAIVVIGSVMLTEDVYKRQRQRRRQKPCALFGSIGKQSNELCGYRKAL